MKPELFEAKRDSWKMMDRQGLEGETYHGEYHQQGDPNSREDLNGDPSREELCREDLSRGELCNLVVFHPTSNNCHTGELVAANNNNNDNVQSKTNMEGVRATGMPVQTGNSAAR